MARPKPGELNKSEAIREYIAKHKRAKAAAIVAAMAEKGIEVRPALVYAVLGKKKTRRGTLKTSKGPKTTSGNGQVSLDTLLAAKKLVTHSGSIESAMAALKVLEQLT